ncbi:flagellar biosynthesis protein FlhB [Desulfovulcanus sp.]
MPQKDPSRTEKATPKRRKKARKEGNVPRSQELSKVMSLLAGVIALRIGISFIGEQIIDLYNWFLDKGIYTEVNQDNIYALFLFCAQKIALIVLPVMMFIALISFITVRLQVGHLWTTKPLKPKFKNFNLVAGLKKIFFDSKTFIRLARSLLQACAVAIAPYLVLKSEFHNLLPLFYESTTGIAAYILDTGYTMTKYALVPMLIIGIADLIYTRWDYEENLKMTKEEIKDERKQAEGDPTIKSKQKQKMLLAMQKRMMKKVPEADVVITNPTHIAVALKYDPMQAPAPLVLAKGAGHVAEKIKEIARKHNVPIKENKPLARALYKSVEVGETIPEELYKAVAALLAQLYKYRRQN